MYRGRAADFVGHDEQGHAGNRAVFRRHNDQTLRSYIAALLERGSRRGSRREKRAIVEVLDEDRRVPIGDVVPWSVVKNGVALVLWTATVGRSR